MWESFFCKKTKTDVCGKISQEGIVRLRSGKKDSVPFSKYFKTDQVKCDHKFVKNWWNDRGGGQGK